MGAIVDSVGAYSRPPCLDLFDCARPICATPWGGGGGLVGGRSPVVANAAGAEQSHRRRGLSRRACVVLLADEANVDG